MSLQAAPAIPTAGSRRHGRGQRRRRPRTTSASPNGEAPPKDASAACVVAVGAGTAANRLAPDAASSDRGSGNRCELWTDSASESGEDQHLGTRSEVAVLMRSSSGEDVPAIATLAPPPGAAGCDAGVASVSEPWDEHGDTDEVELTSSGDSSDSEKGWQTQWPRLEHWIGLDHPTAKLLLQFRGGRLDDDWTMSG
eukprot:CAMPEP_0117605184 /NCGR_PEP_ID=MMETSP0784-20121206/79066_1 /TAXON_ID=39447 /ORGANISM="" /LENGTH=195 /DNA_ID=CAMNT_0005408227 /DNA_START=17 /DNA_END=604 /DNA_ORIENTATION=-